ncbi:IS21 family transposase [Colwellia sp. MSW7]|uniref:IS21 family transposase n=1 Tax=Colwellia maritima TaxID=2912588 RepID=A0ABS9WX19_9GAMM|nr:IS21 family transposase [Colwellia maritima]MCI2282369.1 IS21 family transposase [Colwellia maritima]MCI2283758.1 IS21 family transposase [Colwellia maritima]
MSGKPITKQQVNLYMSYRKDHKQTTAAAQAGMSERTASRIDTGQHSTTKQPRAYRTRKDPLDGAFELHLIPLLKADPKLQPVTLLDQLDNVMPGKFGRNHLRTLQRRVKKWLATEGPDQEVIFRQKYMPGFMGISDYTWMNKLNISIAGEAFEHKLFHYKLVFSGWSYAQVVFSGESFESLSTGLQNAFWRSGGVPQTHRTDSLSAAFNNHYEQETLTERYQKLCKHYGVIATRNNKGVAHENGAIEVAHSHLKQKVDQQLRLRGSRDFATITEYQSFVDLIVAKINRQCKTRFDEERKHLTALPKRRTNDFSEQYVKVTSSSTISIKRVTYTVPSRLIGHRLLVHIYDTRLALFLGHEETLSLPRIYAQGHRRARAVDYKHVIHSLAKKPNAFKYSQLREDLIPEGDFSLLWQQLTAQHVSDKDCRYMVDLLLLAHNYHCEDALGRYVLKNHEQGKRISIDMCRKLFGPSMVTVPNIVSHQHHISDYDSLLGGMHG